MREMLNYWSAKMKTILELESRTFISAAILAPELAAVGAAVGTAFLISFEHARATCSKKAKLTGTCAPNTKRKLQVKLYAHNFP